jgi:hypothetical protein
VLIVPVWLLPGKPVMHKCILGTSGECNKNVLVNRGEAVKYSISTENIDENLPVEDLAG